LGKPKTFDGRETHWRGYRFGISAYAAAVDPHLGALMASAGTVLEADTMFSTLNADNQRLSTQLYYMLALSIDGDTSALTIVERAGPGEGLLAWWRLLQAFEPDTAGRAAALLQEILSFCFETEDIRGSFDTFDLLVKRYESAAADLLPDKLKVGMVGRGLRGPELRQHLLMQAGRLTTYASVREEIHSITTAERAMMLPGEQAPIDVGQVYAEILVVGAELQNETDTVEPINKVNSDRIQVDSGCARSVCPKAFASGPLTQERRYAFTLADGTALPHHGSTVVPYVADGQSLQIPFEVTDVNDPLLSVADTLDHIGGEVVFTRFGGHVKGENGKTLKLVRDGKAYFID
jgi:hypothetical protein